MEFTQETLVVLEEELKLAEMCRPSQPDLLSEIFMAYSQMERIFNSLKYTYERETRYHEAKLKLDVARDNMFRNSDANQLKPLKIRTKK